MAGSKASPRLAFKSAMPEELGDQTASTAPPPASFIWPERSWRSHPAQGPRAASFGGGAFLSRYVNQIEREPFELCNNDPDTTYMLTMNLRSSDFDIDCGAFKLQTRRLALYDMWSTGPRSEPIRGVIRKSAEVFRVVLPEPTVRECFETVHDRHPPDDSVLIPTQFVNDKLVKRLVMSLHEVAESPTRYAEPLVDAAGLVLASRLITLYATQRSKPVREIGGLSQRLLKRVDDYIKANLGAPIYLADLSAVVGLSRTHFAAQFKASTRHSPHRYILGRRIERAKELLVLKESQLADVALRSGFSSQAHFTQVFRRLTGMTPGQWRKEQ